MTTNKEIKELITKITAKGCTVIANIDRHALLTEGKEIIKSVRVIGKGWGPHKMGVISFAEKARVY